MNWWQERERKRGKDCHSQRYIHVVPASRYMRCSTYFVLLLFLCFAGFSQLVGQRQRVATGEEADAGRGECCKRKEKSLFTLLRSVFRFCRQELSPLSKPIRCAEIFSLVAGGLAGSGGRGVIKREKGGGISREIHLLTRKERRLIHWRCSRDPPRMQTQSLQRVTREMIDEGIGEKVAQRGKKKKHRKKKEERKKRPSQRKII